MIALPDYNILQYLTYCKVTDKSSMLHRSKVYNTGTNASMFQSSSTYYVMGDVD